MQNMDDQKLLQRLEEGIEVSSLLPYRYYERKVYYKISLFNQHNRIIVEAERREFNKANQCLQLRIVEVQETLHGIKVFPNSSLINKHMKLNKPRNLKLRTHGKDYSLTGTLILQNDSERA